MSQRNPAVPKTAVASGADGRPKAVSTGGNDGAGAAGTPLTRNEIVNIAALCAAAFVLRLLPIMLIGHATDISTFENWLLVLSQYGPSGFYTHVQFIDYPPGYMLFLWGAAGLHSLMDAMGLARHGIDTLIVAVKLPAILADVGLVYLTYLIMRRNWSTQTALVGGAIITILNPDIAFLSAYWGQADSVAALFLVWAIYLALTERYEWAWASLAFAVLIKPHPIAVAPLFLLWQIRRQGITWRLATIPAVALLVMYLGTAPFYPGPSLLAAIPGFSNLLESGNHFIATAAAFLSWFFRPPIALFQWLYGTYAHGRDGYPYNSVNAFNLYSMKNDFWQSDLQHVVIARLEPLIAWSIAALFGALVGILSYQAFREKVSPTMSWIAAAVAGLVVAIPVRLVFNGASLGPLWLWGVCIFLGFLVAFALRQWRTTGPDVSRQEAENSFLSACFLVMLGYFMLLTRMHERYIFTAIVLIVFVRPLGAVQRIVTLALAATFIVDLFYGLAYLKTPSADLNPLLVHSLSIVNVLCFFAVASIYLIEEFDEKVKLWFTSGARAPRSPPRRSPQLIEGLVAMTRRDWLILLGLTAATAFLLLYRIGLPPGRIFDEIYYARSAQEYLQHVDVFEWTHPPLPKLFMAATSWFFQIWLPSLGGFFAKNQIGDPVSSRIACALAGIATVPVLYAFAKRMFASTAAAVISVLLLMTSGFFFVQARTALPDIFVGLFSLCALYCGYRFFTAGQIVRRIKGSYPDHQSTLATIGVAVGIIVFVGLEVAFYDPSKTPPAISWYIFLAFMALLAAFCAVWARRLALERVDGKIAVYPDGSVAQSGTLTFPSGEQRPIKGASYNDGIQKAAWSAEGVSLTEGETSVRWQADGAITGTAAGASFLDKQQWVVWLILTGLALGAVSASKWYGIFDIATLLIAAVLVTLQGYLPTFWRWRDHDLKLDLDLPRRLLWGNPLGSRLPLFVGGIVLFGMTLYVLTYIPFFSLGRTFQDMLNLQHTMYEYHNNLRATHVYASPWWTWPLDIRPVAYAYDGSVVNPNPLGLRAEVLALPNPFVWIAGLITVPLAGIWAWRERHKGMLIVVGATFLHWLPWVGSPRIDFQYNIYNNTALVCLCTAYVLLRLWRWASAAVKEEPNRLFAVRIAAAAYLALCVISFAYFYPILGYVVIPEKTWSEHMWLPWACNPGQKQDCIGWI